MREWREGGWEGRENKGGRGKDGRKREMEKHDKVRDK